MINPISSLFTPQKSSQPNQHVMVFTTHRAGSMLLHRILRDICQKTISRIAELNRRFSEVLDALGYLSLRYEAEQVPSVK